MVSALVSSHIVNLTLRAFCFYFIVLILKPHHLGSAIHTEPRDRYPPLICHFHSSPKPAVFDKKQTYVRFISLLYTFLSKNQGVFEEKYEVMQIDITSYLAVPHNRNFISVLYRCYTKGIWLKIALFQSYTGH